MQDLYLQSAKSILDLIKTKQVKVEDYAKSLVARIEEKEKFVHAWEYFDEQLLYDKAQLLDKEISNNKAEGALLGLPVGIKDVFNTKDMPTQMGSAVWEGFTPGNNARVVDNIILEGGIAMGKTVTAEFAVHHPGPTLNPHNPDHIVGTSSSGSAAAVATGMVPFALGTQTAGSTTRPASYCGVYGFKPSFGLVPRTGVLKTLDTLDHVTILSRNSVDTKLLLDAIRVRGENYPFVNKNVDVVPDYLSKNTPIKVAFVKSNQWANLMDYTEKSIYDFVGKLGSIDSVVIDEVDLKDIIGGIHSEHQLIYSKALSYYFKDEYENYLELLSDSFKALVRNGQKVSVDPYKQSLKYQAEAQEKMDDFFKDYDVILTPSTVGEAPTMEEPAELPDTSLIWTYLHVPSVSVPIAKGPNNLPYSIQFVARRYHDYKILNFLEYLEEQDVVPKVQIV